MSFWVELHCDGKRAGGHRCGNFLDEGTFARSRSHLPSAGSFLAAQAVEAGWRYSLRTGWACPDCQGKDGGK